MEAEITGENDDKIGLHVTDRNGIKHKIEMRKKDGGIDHHNQNGYSDAPSERTTDEDESVSQARRFAKYHIYRERGHETLSRRQNPDCIAATIVALQQLSDEQFQELFGEYYRQVISHFSGSVSGPIPVLKYVGNLDDFRLFMLDIYLEQDLEEIKASGGAYAEQLATIAEDVAAQTSFAGSIKEALGNFGGNLLDRLDEEQLELPEYTIEGVSDVHMLYYEGLNDERIVEGDRPFEREPDTRLELTPAAVESIGQFRTLVTEHLLCQLRDCYVSMGLEPPAPFRVIGPGFHKHAQKYRHFDMYPDYVDPNANIPGYRV
ncbi:hypothetical protein C482_08546 [Natrialba chahannaoensis JCM 10990]|uniref:Uncharacterized protein n=1 Tax=Natrialba chahannaoensis JCM 10990 TaxID=1227492 RepID=M0AR85_9EURY|nr:hypothetical protein [Natrialba chahannaoensis]ELZ01231.1 hypothetical protein C482_08546 [Natrialba chahannaoensis JCM 10990]